MFCQIHTFLFFTKSRLREKIQFFLKKCFDTEKYIPYMKKCNTFYRMINGSFHEEEWRRRSCRSSRSESTFWRNYFFVYHCNLCCVHVTVYVTNKSQKAIFVDVKENYLLMINYRCVILVISNNGQHRFLSFVIMQMEISFSFEIVGNWIMFWCLVLYLNNDGFKYYEIYYY